MTVQEWVSYHAQTFGLDRPKDLEMVREWADAFARNGYTADEMHQASQWLLSHDPPEHRAQHVSRLLARLMSQRDEENAEPPAVEGPVCPDCGGSGRAIVPRPQTVAGGKWRTYAVLCTCAMGQWFLGRATDRNGRPQLSLMAYERQFPNWRELEKAHRRQEQEQALRENAAQAADQERGPLDIPRMFRRRSQ